MTYRAAPNAGSPRADLRLSDAGRNAGKTALGLCVWPWNRWLRLYERDDLLPSLDRQRRPRRDDFGQKRVDGSFPCASCAGFCAAFSRRRSISRTFCSLFDSSQAHLPIVTILGKHRLNITYHPRRLGGRPRPRDLQGLLTRMSERVAHRFGYVDTDLPYAFAARRLADATAFRSSDPPKTS
jgi:hypothetical protein